MDKPNRPQLERPILIYNECCDFCTDVAYWLQDWLGSDKLGILSNNVVWATGLHVKLNSENIKKNVHLVTLENIKNGYFVYEHSNLYSAGEAVVKVISLKPGFKWIKILYIWPLNYLVELTYYILKKTKHLYKRV